MRKSCGPFVAFLCIKLELFNGKLVNAMSINSIAAPKFGIAQVVKFIGGMGKIRNYHSEYYRWTYLVEMEMGPEPKFGRIGYETMILLPEEELIPL